MSESRALEAPKRGAVWWRFPWHLLVPSGTAFFTGGCTTTLVLVASRLIARSVGSSLYTWTSIFGMALAGLALGHYLGGRLADRYHARRTLAVLFGLSSATCVGMIVANNIAGGWIGLWRLGWPSHVFTHVVLVVLLPTVLLSTVYPIIAKMAVGSGPGRPDQGQDIRASEVPGGTLTHVGSTIGSIYAWAAVGGVVGILLTGFFFIGAFGSAALIWLMGTALLMAAVLYWVSCWALYLWAMVFLALATMGMAGEKWAQDAGTAARLRERPDPNVVYEAETPYGLVAVMLRRERPDQRAFVQDHLPRSEMAVNDATCLISFHQKVYAALTRGLSENRGDLSMLVLGAGGYAFPRHLKAILPDSRVEVVETDAEVTKAALAAFGLEKGAGIQTICMDARCYVDRLLRTGQAGKAAKHYDFIYQDTLHGYAVPAELATKEFNDRIAGLLTEDGVYMIHLLDGDASGRLLGAVTNTVRETFPCVYVITDQAALSATGHSAVVIASRRQFDPQAILERQGGRPTFCVLDDAQVDSLRERCGHVLLTDDYAPTENLAAPMVKRGAAEMLARKYFDRARELQVAYQYEPSIHWYRQALETDPSIAVRAYEQMGLIEVARNRPEAAVEAFGKAIQAHAAPAGRSATMGSVRRQLGLLLGRMDRVKEAKEQFAEAVRAFRVEVRENPAAVVTWEQLGDTLAALGDFPGASDAFDKAAALEPRNPSHYEKLARALELQRRYDEAIVAVQKHVRLMQDLGRRDLATQLNQYIELLKYKRVKQAK